MSLLVADDLYRFFHPGDAEVRALRGASLSVARGETVALVGPSGSGKSTLLACIGGIDEPDGGIVTIDGHRMTRRPEEERAVLRARSIGFLAQSRNLFAHLSVAENILLQLRLAGRSRFSTAGDGSPHFAGFGHKIDELLQLVGLEHRRNASPSTLSGGEAARAGLAVALANDPPLLIADEPTAEVDADTERHVLDVLESRRLNGAAALIATHSPSLARRASRILQISDGRISAAASAPLDHPPAARHRRVGQKAGRILIEAHRLARSFGMDGQRIAAVRPFDCVIRAGQRIALMGRSGSGKSTLLNLFAGLADPDTASSIAWPGFDARRSLRPRQIGFVFQSPSLIPALTVLENVRLPLDLMDASPAHVMDPQEALARLSLSELADKLPDQLSGGQMQRVAMARALVMRPTLLLADEPTGQLDRETGHRVLEALLASIEGTDTALIIATHDETVAEYMDERWSIEAGEVRAPESERFAS